MNGFTLGEEVTWTRPNGTKVEGRVEAMRASGTTMETARGDFHGIQIRVNDEWTPTLPDYTRPAGSPEEGNAGVAVSDSQETPREGREE